MQQRLDGRMTEWTRNKGSFYFTSKEKLAFVVVVVVMKGKCLFSHESDRGEEEKTFNYY